MKNKVYMEKLPKNCFECPCFRNDIEQCCALDDEDEQFFLDEIDGGNCPLIKVSDTKMYQEGYLQRKFDEEADKILKEKSLKKQIKELQDENEVYKCTINILEKQKKEIEDSYGYLHKISKELGIQNIDYEKQIAILKSSEKCLAENYKKSNADKINFVLAELEKVQNFVWDMSFDIKGKGAIIRLYDMNCMLKNQREEIEKLRRKNEEKQPNISS